MNFFPENKVTNYSTHLHAPLDLGQGEWEVGMAEIQYPHTWLNLRSATETRVEVLRSTEAQGREKFLKKGFYNNAEDLVTAMNQQFTSHVKFKWDHNSKKVTAEVQAGRGIKLSRTLASMLGLPRLLGTSIGVKKTIVGKRVDDIRRGLDSLYVYCDLVRHRIVGDTSVPLLRIVPVRGSHGSYITRAYENIQYLPVRGGEVQTIEIDIRDDTGKPVPFESGRVVVILHLRRVRSPYL